MIPIAGPMERSKLNLSSLQYATDEQKKEAFKKKEKGMNCLESVEYGHLKIKNINNQYII